MTVIIDTDPGIDDAIAILYALGAADLDVVALTTVAGNIGLSVTTHNAGRICALAGADLPVHAGAAAPLGKDPCPEIAIHGDDGLGGVVFPAPLRPAAPEDAVAAMVRILTEQPDQSVDLFCLGPLTNLALLLEQAPDAAQRIRRVVAMGGAVDEPGNAGPKAEFNIAHDPDAAAAGFAGGLALTLIPLDATRQLRAGKDYIKALRDAGSAASVTSADLIAAYFAAKDGAESRPLHDPCVPLLAQHPEMFRIEPRDLDVDLDTGALIPGPHRMQVAMGLDADRLRAALLAGVST